MTCLGFGLDFGRFCKFAGKASLFGVTVAVQWLSSLTASSGTLTGLFYPARPPAPWGPSLGYLTSQSLKRPVCSLRETCWPELT